MLEDSCRHHIFAWCHAVGKCLRPLDSVHVCRVSPLIAADNSGGPSQSLGYRHAADIRPEQLLEVLCEWLELLCVDLLPALREVFILIIKFNTLLSDIPVLVPVKFTDIANEVLMQGIGHVEHLNIPVPKGIHERAIFQGTDRFTRENINILLPALHSVHIFFKADKLIFSLRLT